jgi:hypothetical protein
MHPPLPGDKSAGFIGLVAGAVSIFIVVYAIALLTARSFAGHGGPAGGQHAPAAPGQAAPAPAGQHAPPPPGAPAPARH